MSAEFKTIYDALPPFQQTIVELLIARYRLGEPTWTLGGDAFTRNALDVLQTKDIVWWKHGIVENSTLAGLNPWVTDTLRPYRAPALAKAWDEGYTAGQVNARPNPYQR